jgi:glycosyltransferase involved in cell wall biosynthesis
MLAQATNLMAQIVHHKPTLGNTDANICYIWPLNNVGGIETLIYRHGLWLKERGFAASLITCVGAMDSAYAKAFDQIISLASHELDLSCLTDEEFAEVIETVAQRLGGHAPFHFIFFNHLGAYIASRLAERFEGSRTTLYILEDRILGPERLEFVDQMNNAGMVITMNDACAAGHRELYGYQLEPAPEVIPLAVDLAQRMNVTARGGVSLLAVARLHPMKEYVFGLIEAVAVLREEGYKELTLTVVGDGPLRTRLVALVRARGLESHVRFAGTVAPAELPRYYTEADIFVGMGTTLLEASSLGLASVVAIGHCPEFKSPGFFSDTSGYYVGEAISDLRTQPGMLYIRQLLGSPRLLQCVSEECRQKVEREFSIESVMSRFIAKIKSTNAVALGVPMPVRPAQYGKVRRFMKRRLRRIPLAMSLGRLARKLLGGIDF